MGQRIEPRVYKAETGPAIFRYAIHCLRSGQFVCVECVRESDITARPTSTAKGHCQRCGVTIVAGCAWYVVGPFEEPA